jgi:glycyl-tRNA synthetase beta chain
MIDERPTGSRDPFALRRAALGVMSIMQASGNRLPLLKAASQFRVISTDSIPPSADGWRETLLDFFADRLKVQQREAGVRHDLIDAVFALGGEDDLVRLLARVKALQAFVATDDGANLLAGYKRAANILKIELAKGDPGSAGGAAAVPAEAALAAALDAALPAASAAVKAEDFAGAMTALAGLRAPVDRFFADVMVNDPDPMVRAGRLALLARFRDAVHEVADFSRIEG